MPRTRRSAGPAGAGIPAPVGVSAAHALRGTGFVVRKLHKPRDLCDTGATGPRPALSLAVDWETNMNTRLAIVMLLGAFAARAAGPTHDLAAGRAYYAAGEFRKAAAQFRQAVRANPGDAEACYWTGMAYQSLADIATPFGGLNSSRARDYLTRAANLAPANPVYRRALFDFLLDSSRFSRGALRQAAGVLLTTPESDPDYFDMRRRLENQRSQNSAAAVRLGEMFLTVPRAAYRVAELPASVVRVEER